MHLHTRNVNTAFHELVSLFANDDYAVNGEFEGGIVKKQSRNGPVLMIDEPVLVTYSHPRERVLFNAARDCNPFFHLYEAFWMIAGRNDVAPLVYYAKNMANYSDDGVTLNGAYGYRWRHSTIPGYIREPGYANLPEGVDQLNLLVEHLKADPSSRRAVLQMWNVEDDLLKIGKPMGNIDSRLTTTGSKDVCCNLSVMFSIREIPEKMNDVGDPIHYEHLVLDMTVTNRSNDMIWGMLGANYVHFTFLQEYIAARLGVEVGVYNHFTNNLHVYESNWKPEEWLKSQGTVGDPYWDTDYENVKDWKPYSLVKDPATFEREVVEFVDINAKGTTDPYFKSYWKEPFLRDVAQPMLYAFHFHKIKDHAGATYRAKEIKADDWRISCVDWLKRREKKRGS